MPSTMADVGPIVPVVVIDDETRAGDVALALAEGGIHCAEVTLRTDAGLGAIAAIADLGIPGFVVGAGTVLNRDDLERSLGAGAQFIVSPGFDDEVVSRALDAGVAVLPGVATATEVQRAINAGVDTVKLFPADRLGGLPTIVALAAPFRHTRFVPSGGVTADNALEYLGHPAVPAVSGSWMVTRQMIARGDFTGISRVSQEFTSRLGSRS